MKEIDEQKDTRSLLLKESGISAVVDHLKHFNRRYCELQNAIGLIPNLSEMKLSYLYASYSTKCTEKLKQISKGSNTNKNNFSVNLKQLTKNEFLGMCLKNANSQLFGKGDYYALVTKIHDTPPVLNASQTGLYVSWKGSLSKLESLIYNEESPLKNKFASISLDSELKKLFGELKIVNYKVYDSVGKQYKYLKVDSYKKIIQQTRVHLTAAGTIAAKTADKWISYGRSSSSRNCPVLALKHEDLQFESKADDTDDSFSPTKQSPQNKKKRKNTKQGGKKTKHRKREKTSLDTILEEGWETMGALGMFDEKSTQEREKSASKESVTRRSSRKHATTITSKPQKRDKHQKLYEEVSAMAKKDRPFDIKTRFPRDLSHTKHYKEYVFGGQGRGTDDQVCLYLFWHCISVVMILHLLFIIFDVHVCARIMCSFCLIRGI